MPVNCFKVSPGAGDLVLDFYDGSFHDWGELVTRLAVLLSATLKRCEEMQTSLTVT